MKRTVTTILIALGIWTYVNANAADGSMFNETTYQGLVTDQKAHQVGDSLTVLIQEVAAATSSVDSRTNRGANFGLQGQVNGHDPKGISAGVTSTSDGGGQVIRSGRVTAQITVTVVAIEPNGELRIKGQQQVDVNGEAQIIAVSGRLRVRDISDSNTVLSSRIAESHVTYNGQGYISERSRPNILSRFLNFFGL